MLCPLAYLVTPRKKLVPFLLLCNHYCSRLRRKPPEIPDLPLLRPHPRTPPGLDDALHAGVAAPQQVGGDPGLPIDLLEPQTGPEHEQALHAQRRPHDHRPEHQALSLVATRRKAQQRAGALHEHRGPLIGPALVADHTRERMTARVVGRRSQAVHDRSAGRWGWRKVTQLQYTSFWR